MKNQNIFGNNYRNLADSQTSQNQGNIHQKPQRHLQEKQTPLIRSQINFDSKNIGGHNNQHKAIRTGVSKERQQLIEQAPQLKHSLYFSNQNNIDNNNLNYYQNNSNEQLKDSGSLQVMDLQKNEVYQDYLDIDIGLESNQTLSKDHPLNINSIDLNSIDDRSQRVRQTSNDCESETDNIDEQPEEIQETRSDILRKKPNSVTGILGREGGAGLLRSQIARAKQFNNFLGENQPLNPNYYPSQLSQVSHQYLQQIEKSNLQLKTVQTPQLLLRGDMSSLNSPLGFTQASLHTLSNTNGGFKTPTIELQNVLEGNNKNHKNHARQQQLVPVQELNINSLVSSNLGNTNQAYTSRNDDLRNNTSSKTLKSQNTVNYKTNNAGLNQNNDGNSSEISSQINNNNHNQNQISTSSKSSQLTGNKQKFVLTAQNQLTNIKRSIESPTIPTSNHIVFTGPKQVGKKISKKTTKKPMQLQNNNSKANHKQADQKKQNSNSFMKNYQSVPNIQQSKSQQQQQIPPQINEQIQMVQSQQSQFQTVYGVQQARSAQGFVNPSQLFDSKYNNMNQGITPQIETFQKPNNLIDLKTEITSLLKNTQPGAPTKNKLNSLKSSYQSAQGQNVVSKRPTPKSSFTQVIHITQGENPNGQKTQDILVQHLNEKSREVASLKNENKDLQERLFQAEKQIIYLAAMQSNFHTHDSLSNSGHKSSKKHFKTLSLKDNYNLSVKEAQNINMLNNANKPTFLNNDRMNCLGDDFQFKGSFTPNDKIQHSKQSMFKNTRYVDGGAGANLGSPASQQSILKVNLDDQNDYSAKKDGQNNSEIKSMKQKKKSVDLLINTNPNSLLMPQGNQKLESIFRVMSPNNFSSQLQNSAFNALNNLQHQRTMTSQSTNRDELSSRSTQNLNQQDMLQQQQQSFQLMKMMTRVKSTLDSYKQREQLLLKRIKDLETSYRQNP
ncbi:UNKNOWN [Stylonychia lemnae]|uniref:Uncharacterized protein n=1 Tax=Stylonychia lemnae TaxID=5949 RepID=A0A078A1Y4_STYLE|nr:UNKNOWN [Stylonychia lemnae]|eukprot:CDW76145.1 UNKNOWN [Stylonychia lemnae]